MVSSRIISILILAVFGFTLGSEFFSSHDSAAACGAEERAAVNSEASAQHEVRASDFEFSEESKEIPCSDPCHQSYCHLGHCSHLTIASVLKIKAAPQLQLQIYGATYERYIPTQHLSSIFRPPIHS